MNVLTIGAYKSKMCELLAISSVLIDGKGADAFMASVAEIAKAYASHGDGRLAAVQRGKLVLEKAIELHEGNMIAVFHDVMTSAHDHEVEPVFVILDALYSRHFARIIRQLEKSFPDGHIGDLRDWKTSSLWSRLVSDERGRHRIRSWMDLLRFSPYGPKWALLRCAVRLLSVHKRAALTANHPSRKQARGEFNVSYNE